MLTLSSLSETIRNPEENTVGSFPFESIFYLRFAARNLSGIVINHQQSLTQLQNS